MQFVFTDITQEEIMKCMFFHASVCQPSKSREDMSAELIKMIDGSD